MKDGMTTMVNKPKKPIKYWQVCKGKIVYYSNNSVSLCYYFLNNNQLKGAQVKAVY